MKFLSSLLLKQNNNFIFSKFPSNRFCNKINKNPLNQKSPKKLSLKKRMKAKIKKYGLFGLYFYMSTYLFCGLSIYSLFKLGILDSKKIANSLVHIGIEQQRIDSGLEYWGQNHLDLVCTLILNEILELIRLPTVVFCLPSVYKIFRRIKPLKK